MLIKEMAQKRSIEFEKIRNGTVFTMNGVAYIKGDGKYAVDLDTGHVTDPEKTGVEWSECYIYPRASLKLN